MWTLTRNYFEGSTMQTYCVEIHKTKKSALSVLSSLDYKEVKGSDGDVYYLGSCGELSVVGTIKKTKIHNFFNNNKRR